MGHDGDRVLYVDLKFALVEPGVDSDVLSQSTPAVRRALWAIDERHYPHLRYHFQDNQSVIDTELRPSVCEEGLQPT